MEQEKEIALRRIEDDFGTGYYVSWQDKETKQVLITNWGCYDKETESGKKLAFRASVLNLNGKEYLLGDKVIDTTSMNFHKTIAPYLLNAQKFKESSLNLEISRAGDKKDTVFFIKLLPMVTKQCKLK